MPRSGAAVAREVLPAPESWEDARFRELGGPRELAAARAERRLASAGEAGLPSDGALSDRRTVTIGGHGTERGVGWDRYRARPRPTRRPARRAYEHAAHKPDRLAMWAVLLGVLLVLVSAASSHAAVATHASSSRPAALTRQADTPAAVDPR